MSESTFAEFLTYYKNLPHAEGTCHIYERNDVYSVYGDDAFLINQEVPKGSRLKVAETGDETLSYVNIIKSHFILALKYLLFVRQYKIEILKNTGTVMSPQWTVCYKVSPGNLTAIEDLILNDNASFVQESRGLMAIKIASDASDLVVGVAFCYPVLREIQIYQFKDNSELTNLQSVLVQLSPQECLVAAAASGPKTPSRVALDKIVRTLEIPLTEVRAENFSSEDLDNDLNRLLTFVQGVNYKRGMKDKRTEHAFSAVAALIKYLELLAERRNFHRFVLSVYKCDMYAKLDIQSVTGLRLFPPCTKNFYEKRYLLGHLNNCSTHLGERLLVQWIKRPLTDLKELEKRLDVVEIFVNDFTLRHETSKLLSKLPDIETVCGKIQRRQAGLKDLYELYMLLIQLEELITGLSAYNGCHADILKEMFVRDLEERMKGFSQFFGMMKSVLDFEALEDGEFLVKAERDDLLLDITKKMLNVRSKIMSTFDDVKDDLDSASVKLECCYALGYHFRLARKEEQNLRRKNGYVIIDSKASGVLFQSASLKNLNDQYISIRQSYEEMQKEIVDGMIGFTVYFCPRLLKLIGNTIAWLDVSLSLASVSVNAPKPYIRPKLREKGDCCIILKQARHPILESRVESFIPNDVEINRDNHTFYFVTGHNMGGKSTFIRSVALNVLMAQIGCFVPCDYAEISVVDAFLTRIGANDKASNGVSTLMCEMAEAQSVVESATSSSLLIIDEMGRGTSIYDGFGLSWAVSRHIAGNLKAPCLFATCFHELTGLSECVPTMSNLHVEVISSQEDIFLYNVKPGVCDESYGIHVAKMASFPDLVIKEGKGKLDGLDKAHVPVDEIISEFEAFPAEEVSVKAVQPKLAADNKESAISEPSDVSVERYGNYSQLESLSEEDTVKE